MFHGLMSQSLWLQGLVVPMQRWLGWFATCQPEFTPGLPRALDRVGRCGSTTGLWPRLAPEHAFESSVGPGCWMC